MSFVPKSVSNSRSAFELLKDQFNPHAEEFWGLFLNNHLSVIDFKLIHRGTVDSCSIHPRDLFREAIKLKRIGLLIQIPVIDHVIFSDFNYYSFKEHQSI